MTLWSCWVSGGQRLVNLSILVIISIWCNLHGTNASVKCYFCIFAPVSNNITCLLPGDDMAGVSIVECPDYAVCVIRSYFSNNQVMEFSRTCEVSTLSRVDQCFITSGTSECQTFCTTDLCNVGDGKVGGGASVNTPASRLVALLAVVGVLLVHWHK